MDVNIRIIIGSTMLTGAALLAACGSDAPKPLEAKNISAPLKPAAYLPPGVSSALKEGETVSLKAPTPIRTGPTARSEGNETLPPGTLVRLKSRVLNGAGSWWLVDAPNVSGWMTEAELLRK